MSKLPLFDESEAWTQEANDIALEVRNALAGIFDKHGKKYRLRDIQYIAAQEVELLSLDRITRQRVRKHIPNRPI